MLPRSVRPALYFVVGLMLGASVTFAHAGYALPSSPPGFSVTSAGYMYRAPAGVAAVNGAFHTGVSVNVAGKAVTVPAAMRFASNAPSYVAGAMRSKLPWAVGAAFVAWAATEFIEWDGQDWMSNTPWAPPELSAVSGEIFATCGWYTSGVSASVRDECIDVSTASLNNTYPNRWGYRLTHAEGYWPLWRAYTCNSGYHMASGGCVSGAASGMGQVTDDDWNRLAAAPLPDSVAQEAAKNAPFPVQTPDLAPVTEPLSQPYLDPVTGQPYRDMVRITPSPTSESPFRVRVDPYREPMTSADPDAVPVDQNQPGAPGNEAIPEEHKQLCEQFPDASACAKLGSGADPGPVEEQAVDVTAIQPVSIGATGGTCPSDRVMQTQFGTLAFEWATLCAFAEGVRPVILAMAWLVAGFGFFYGAKRSQ